jgi:hypothetical protein
MQVSSKTTRPIHLHIVSTYIMFAIMIVPHVDNTGWCSEGGATKQEAGPVFTHRCSWRRHVLKEDDQKSGADEWGPEASCTGLGTSPSTGTQGPVLSRLVSISRVNSNERNDEMRPMFECWRPSAFGIFKCTKYAWSAIAFTAHCMVT